MYFDQKLVIKSPMILTPIKTLHDRLAVVVGDSLLINNIALMFAQGYIYTTENTILDVAISFGDNISNDMLFHYQSILGISADEARESLKKDVYDFIIQAAHFFRNDYSIQIFLKQSAELNCYLCIDRVMDDASSPYIEASIKRRT